eukprot:TRINITY_DN2691_c0_g1_i3.p1 TRINITY_DN2691_c0_g1~~TRINITY_DN2691_c0_g1_i3.p1  ORF type:complete len:170 (+),score=39.29 TRINITY_DN2691_c0_g1_i3:115-624(+)
MGDIKKTIVNYTMSFKQIQKEERQFEENKLQQSPGDVEDENQEMETLLSDILQRYGIDLDVDDVLKLKEENEEANASELKKISSEKIEGKKEDAITKMEVTADEFLKLSPQRLSHSRQIFTPMNIKSPYLADIQNLEVTADPLPRLSGPTPRGSNYKGIFGTSDTHVFS